MSVGNVGSGSDPSRFPNEENKSLDSSSLSKKAKNLWSRLKGSSENVENKTTSSKTQRKITSKLPSPQEPLSRKGKLETLGRKTESLSSSSASFLETTRKLEEKYKNQASIEVSKKIHRSRKKSRGFLALVKGKLQIPKKQEDNSVSSKVFEETTSSNNTLENLNRFESNLKEEAETVESVNCCLDDCCGCLKKLKSLFKNETHIHERSRSSCCENFKKSLLKIKEEIKKSTESIKNAVKKRMRLNSVSFKQQVYRKTIRELLKTSNLENRAAVALFGIKSLAQITGFDCKVNKNGLSFSPKLEEEIFSSRIRLFSGLVDELLLEIDEIDPQAIDSKEIQKRFELTVIELSNYSNYFWHLFGLF